MGCDIAQGMLDKAEARSCFNRLDCSDANKALPAEPNSMDVAICTGALELLDIPAVLTHTAGVLKSGGELWASFQWDNGKPSPTAHQNVSGMTEDEVGSALLAVGLRLVSVTKCDRAFVTPSPSGELQDVPYLFCRAVKP